MDTPEITIELRLEEQVIWPKTHVVQVLQQRTKTRWLDGSTTDNGCYGWSDWEDVPIKHL